MTVLLKLDVPDLRALKSESGRAPAWSIFDADWYLRRYPDAAAQMREIGLTDAEVFYRNYGARLGHSPNMFFDEVYYLRSYPDIAAHVRRGAFRSGFEHYCRDGFRKLAPHWLFSVDFYEKTYHDVTPGALAKHGLANSYDHYIVIGDREYRSGHWLFDPILYRDNKPADDHSKAGAGGSFAQFLAGGCIAGTQASVSWYFDPIWYLQTYPQVAATIAAGQFSCALEHFLCNTTPQDFYGHELFSAGYYCATYPDMQRVSEAGKFRALYDHFVRHGAGERRSPHPDVDLRRYAQNPSVQADLALGLFRDAFAHFVARKGIAPAPISAPAPVEESQTKQLFLKSAATLMPQLGRHAIDFSVAQGIAPEISVIMVMHNQFTLTMMTLASLRENFPGGIELILVDSGSRDETSRIEQSVKGAKLIRFGYNAGFVEACNMALAHVTAPALLFLNNDLLLGPNACRLALSRLRSDPSIGAVGGKLIRTNGLLQEAGSIVWRNGQGMGYLRDADPNAPEANFVRDVDYCSAAFLMVRTVAVLGLGGFDDDYRPAYYEDADLCLRLRKAGYRVLYDPAVMINHLEFGSGSLAGSMRMMERNHKIFVTKHQEYLRYQQPPQAQNAIRARSARPLNGIAPVGGKPLRILFIEDRVPLRRLGSGYVRSNDIVRFMAAAGHMVSVFPIMKTADSLVEIYRDMPDNVEVVHDRHMGDLINFIRQRPGFYDVVWVGRTHNLGQLLPTFIDNAACLPEQGFVLDTEAVVASRTAERYRVLGQAPEEGFERALDRELACAYYCQSIIAVNDVDAALVRKAGYQNVSILGHMKQPVPTASTWDQRRNLLFLGAIHEQKSPNYDSLEWFLAEVLPLLEHRLPSGTRFTIAGYARAGIDFSSFARHPNVDLIGPVADPAALYDTHRVFVAPTRFAGGIPYKVHEAAAYGLPVVATDLLCRQLGWSDRVEIMNGGAVDAAQFADSVCALYEDADLWQMVRDGAISRLRQDCDPQAYAANLEAILRSAVV